MKRDMDLIREILFQIEKAPYTGAWVELEIEGRTPEEIAYHLILLNEAELVNAENISGYGDIDVRPIRLTWEGHEFLDAAKNDRIWNKAKSMISDKAGGLVFALLKEALLQLLRAELSIP